MAKRRIHLGNQENVTDLEDIIDWQVLQSIREIQAPDDNLIERIVDLYVEHAPVALEKLNQCAPAADPVEIAAAAHALKSLSRNVGAIRAGDLAGLIEAAAEGSGKRPASTELTELGDVLARTITELRNHIDLKAAA